MVFIGSIIFNTVPPPVLQLLLLLRRQHHSAALITESGMQDVCVLNDKLYNI